MTKQFLSAPELVRQLQTPGGWGDQELLSLDVHFFKHGFVAAEIMGL